MKVLIIFITIPLFVTPKPASFDSSTGLWTVTDLIFALRHDITGPLIQVNLKYMNVGNKLRTIQTEAERLRALTSTAKAGYLTKSNAYVFDAFMYALLNRLPNVAAKLIPLNQLIQTSADDVEKITKVVGDEAVHYSTQVTENVQTEMARYGQAVEGMFICFENRTLDTPNSDRTCINQGIHEVRDVTMEYYERVVECLDEEHSSTKSKFRLELYNQSETVFNEIQTLISDPIKACIKSSLEKELSDTRATENDAYTCMEKILSLDGHDLIDTPAIIETTKKSEALSYSRVNTCTTDTTDTYMTKLRHVMTRVDSCLSGNSEKNTELLTEPVIPEKQGIYPYMFIDNLPIYCFNMKK